MELTAREGSNRCSHQDIREAISKQKNIFRYWLNITGLHFFVKCTDEFALTNEILFHWNFKKCARFSQVMHHETKGVTHNHNLLIKKRRQSILTKWGMCCCGTWTDRSAAVWQTSTARFWFKSRNSRRTGMTKHLSVPDAILNHASNYMPQTAEKENKVVLHNLNYKHAVYTHFSNIFCFTWLKYFSCIRLKD